MKIRRGTILFYITKGFTCEWQCDNRYELFTSQFPNVFEELNSKVTFFS